MLATTRERERVTSTITLASNADVQKQIEALKRRESSAEIAEQIEAIKAENEALKAKKAENNKIIKKGFLGFCRGKYSATGCFIGGEVGLAITDNWLWLDYDMLLYASDSLSKNKTSVAIPINLTFGYQWYYKNNQALRLKANVGYANYNVDYSLELLTENNYEEVKSSLENHALQYGLELAWLWDFVRKGKHTLGIDLGTGFEGSTFFHSTKKENDEYNNEYGQGGQVTSRLVGSNTQVVWVSRIGLHYYFNVNHQFFLNYAYKGYSSINGAEIFDEMDGKKQGEALGYFANYARNRIYLGYSYKF